MSESTDSWLQRINVFISSPSDVSQEREAVIRVIERINRLSYIRKQYVLTPLLYEKEVPPEAGDHAQMIVDRYIDAKKSYLLICIMWNRMGTPFKHPETGEEFQSGTEYEFTVGYRANQNSGKPHLLLYRKITDRLDIDVVEKDKVDKFFQKFETNESPIKGLYKTFDSLHEFEQMIFEHIERVLTENPPANDSSSLRIESDTRPDIVEESRRLDAAMPRECSIRKSTEVRVMICLPDAEGLKGLLPDFTAEGDLIDKTDVQYGSLAVGFPIDKATQNPIPIKVTVELKSDDFNFNPSVQQIQLSPKINSGQLVYEAIPHKVSGRGRIHIIVKSEHYDGYTIVLGATSITSNIRPDGSDIDSNKIWNIISFPLQSLLRSTFPKNRTSGNMPLTEKMQSSSEQITTDDSTFPKNRTSENVSPSVKTQLDTDKANSGMNIDIGHLSATGSVVFAGRDGSITINTGGDVDQQSTQIITIGGVETTQAALESMKSKLSELKRVIETEDIDDETKDVAHYELKTIKEQLTASKKPNAKILTKAARSLYRVSPALESAIFALFGEPLVSQIVAGVGGIVAQFQDALNKRHRDT